MAIKRIEVNLYICERCGHEWTAQRHTSELIPVQCASCGSNYWNRPRTRKYRRKEAASV